MRLKQCSKVKWAMFKSVCNQGGGLFPDGCWYCLLQKYQVFLHSIALNNTKIYISNVALLFQLDLWEDVKTNNSIIFKSAFAVWSDDELKCVRQTECRRQGGFHQHVTSQQVEHTHVPKSDASLFTIPLSSFAAVKVTNHYHVKNRNGPPM